MNYGFDLEGTLDAEPEMFRNLCSALVAADEGVYVITAYYHPEGGVDVNQEQIRYKQLNDIGFIQGIHYTEMKFAPGVTARGQGNRKQSICADLEIRLMFEDRQIFADEISKVSRSVMMVPRS